MSCPLTSNSISVKVTRVGLYSGSASVSLWQQNTLSVNANNFAGKVSTSLQVEVFQDRLISGSALDASMLWLVLLLMPSQFV